MPKPSVVKVYRKNESHNCFYIARSVAARIIRHNKRTATLLNEGAWAVRVPNLGELMLVTWFA